MTDTSAGSLPIVEVESLRKDFRVLEHRRGLWGAAANLLSTAGRTVRAIDDVSFRLFPGEFVGYVGPNGAGKSTTIKALVGILRPTSGRARVLGRDPHRHRRTNARRIGVVFGQRTQLWWDLPPGESFSLLGRIYRVPRGDFVRRRDELVARLQLGPLLDTPVRKLSLGQKMRCELVAALLHGPEIVFLDEPTIGLDVVAKEEVREFLLGLNRNEGTTVVLTSHDLDDIERLCRRVLVIDRGCLLHDGSVESLRRHFGHERVLLVEMEEPFEGDLPLPEGAAIRERGGRRLRIEFDADRVRAPDLIRQVLEHRGISDLRLQEREIEEVVRRIYRG